MVHFFCQLHYHFRQPSTEVAFANSCDDKWFFVLTGSGMAVAEPGHQNQLTEVYEMKNARTFLFVVLLGSIAATRPVLAADGAAANREVMPLAGYCHLKLPAIQARSLATDDPIPKDASSGDIIDY